MEKYSLNALKGSQMWEELQSARAQAQGDTLLEEVQTTRKGGCIGI